MLPPEGRLPELWMFLESPKTAGKVATDEHSFDVFVAEQQVQLAALGDEH